MSVVMCANGSCWWICGFWIFVLLGLISSVKGEMWKRVITDPNSIHSKFGVAVDFRYNESLSETADIASSPGCPSSIKELPWVYVGLPPRCFVLGTQGPCPPGQLLFSNFMSPYGYCDCKCVEGGDSEKTSTISTVILEHSGLRFCRLQGASEVNEAVFDKQLGLCFFLETQAICNGGEWLVKDETGRGTVCVPQCASAVGPLTSQKFDYNTRQCVPKQEKPIVQPISLGMGITQSDCEDGKVYSKLLNKCVTRSKGFLMKL